MFRLQRYALIIVILLICFIPGTIAFAETELEELENKYNELNIKYENLQKQYNKLETTVDEVDSWQNMNGFDTIASYYNNLSEDFMSKASFWIGFLTVFFTIFAGIAIAVPIIKENNFKKIKVINEKYDYLDRVIALESEIIELKFKKADIKDGNVKNQKRECNNQILSSIGRLLRIKNLTDDKKFKWTLEKAKILVLNEEYEKGIEIFDEAYDISATKDEKTLVLEAKVYSLYDTKISDSLVKERVIKECLEICKMLLEDNFDYEFLDKVVDKQYEYHKYIKGELDKSEIDDYIGLYSSIIKTEVKKTSKMPTTKLYGLYYFYINNCLEKYYLEYKADIKKTEMKILEHCGKKDYDYTIVCFNDNADKFGIKYKRDSYGILE